MSQGCLPTPSLRRTAVPGVGLGASGWGPDSALLWSPLGNVLSCRRSPPSSPLFLNVPVPGPALLPLAALASLSAGSLWTLDPDPVLACCLFRASGWGGRGPTREVGAWPPTFASLAFQPALSTRNALLPATSGTCGQGSPALGQHSRSPSLSPLSSLSCGQAFELKKR